MGSVTARIIIKAPLRQVFNFIADGENAPKWHPSIKEAKRMPGTKLGVGSTVRYVAKVGPMELIWITRAEAFEENKMFKDVLVKIEKGPLKDYELYGEFAEVNGWAKITMSIKYELGMGVLGKLLDLLFINRRVRKHMLEGLNKARELLER